jgi:hypothetical protein
MAAVESTASIVRHVVELLHFCGDHIQVFFSHGCLGLDYSANALSVLIHTCKTLRKYSTRED